MSRVSCASPPKLIDAFLLRVGMSEEELEAELEATLESFLQTITVESSELTFQPDQVVQLENGMWYATIPTVVTMSLIADPYKMVISYGDTVAVYIENEWYFVLIDSAGRKNEFSEAYPEFASLEVRETRTVNKRRSE